MSVACVTRESLQTSLVPTNEVVRSTRQTTIGQGGQTTQVAYTTVSCAASTRSSVVATSCNTRTLTMATVIPGTQIVSQVVVTMTVSGYATFINTLHETICTTGPLPPPTTTPRTTEPPRTTAVTITTMEPPRTTAVTITTTEPPTTIAVPITTTPPSTTTSVTSSFIVPPSSTSPTPSLSRTTVGPNDDPASLSSLAAQDQPSESSTSSNGVPMAPIVGGVVGGVGGALLLGLLIYFLLFRRSSKPPANNYDSNTLDGQAQIDPGHYEYTPVHMDQWYSNGRTSEQGGNVIPQAGSQYVNPFLDYPSSQAATGGAFAAATQIPTSAVGGSPLANSGTPSSLGSVYSTAPMVRRHMPQPSFGSMPTQYRGLAEPADSRF